MITACREDDKMCERWAILGRPLRDDPNEDAVIAEAERVRAATFDSPWKHALPTDKAFTR